jgi:hypothetical protein
LSSPTSYLSGKALIFRGKQQKRDQMTQKIQNLRENQELQLWWGQKERLGKMGKTKSEQGRVFIIHHSQAKEEAPWHQFVYFDLSF